MSKQLRASLSTTKTFSPSTSISTISKLMHDTHLTEKDESPMTKVEDNLQNSEFASKKWVWIPDEKLAFIKGFVVSEDSEDGQLRIRCVDDSVSIL